ncbi:MAG: fimbrillin family protein [Bacteroidales bacterium]|nr:fimbrillin family protein [Bacteroidales bacterium]
MKRTLLAAILATAAIAFSCTVEEPAQSDSLVFNPTATVEDFVLDGATKTILSATGNQVTIEFSDDDILNLYPVNPTGNGLPFKVLENKGSSCIFDGRERGFGLYEGTSYAAFYPGTGEGGVAPAANKVPVDFTGQWLWDFGSTDFLYATGIEPKEKEGCKFTMKHLGALLPIKVTFDKATPITELSLTSDKTPFILSGTVDLTKNPVVIKSEKTAKTVSMSLDPEAYTKASAEVFSVDAGEVVNFFMMIAPVDMTGSIIQVEVKNGKEVVASSEIEGKNFAAGTAYSVEVEVEEPVDLSANETANSYIVSEPGYYSIDATIAGNGRMASWDAAFAPYVYPAYNFNTGVVNKFVGNDVLVVLNQNGCVSDVRYKDGKILFKATGKEGNAKLTLMNGSAGVWTWHIWCTDAPAVRAFEVYGYDYHIMDRNMGAISDGTDNATCEELSGLYYQYGNPIGYTFEDFYNEGYQGYLFNGRGIATMQYSLALNPTKPTLNVTAAAESKDRDYVWFQYLGIKDVSEKSTYAPIWGGGSDIDGSLKYGDEVVKTLYDPCPAGYKIMGCETFEDFTSSDTFSGNSKGMFVPLDDGDIFLPYNGAAWPDDENGAPFWMASGPYPDANGRAVYSTLWLSGHIGRNMAYFNSFYAKNANTGAFQPSPRDGHIIARGFGVRCMADEFDYSE